MLEIGHVELVFTKVSRMDINPSDRKNMSEGFGDKEGDEGLGKKKEV